MRKPTTLRTTIAAGALIAAGACNSPREAAQADSAAGGSPMAKLDSTEAAGTVGEGGAGSTTAREPEAPQQAVLTALGGLGGKPIETLTPAEARKQPTPTDAVNAVLKQQGKDTTPTALVPGVTSADRSIRGAAGNIPARIYTPEGAGPFPVIVYFHGGGWVIGSKEVYDGGARGLAKAANAVVISPDYRLAPEAKFPAQHDDALATYRWAAQNAASIKGDTARMALAGESAGGNLAVATAVAVRDVAGLPKPRHVLAVYPIAQPDTTTASYTAYANAKPLNRAMMGWFAKHTVRTPADLKDPRINLVAADLKGLAPVTIVTAEIDPLRDDGPMLQRALEQAGVKVELRKYDGVAHEFFGQAAVVEKAKEAQQYAGDRLKGDLGAR